MSRSISLYNIVIYAYGIDRRLFDCYRLVLVESSSNFSFDNKLSSWEIQVRTSAI